MPKTSDREEVYTAAIEAIKKAQKAGDPILLYIEKQEEDYISITRNGTPSSELRVLLQVIDDNPIYKDAKKVNRVGMVAAKMMAAMGADKEAAEKAEGKKNAGDRSPAEILKELFETVDRKLSE